MKPHEMLILLAVSFLIFSLMSTDFNSELDEDMVINEKIEIIEKAQSSSDPLVQHQGEIAKQELELLQAKKIEDIKKQEEKIENQKEVLKPFSESDTEGKIVIILIMVLTIVTMLGIYKAVRYTKMH